MSKSIAIPAPRRRPSLPLRPVSLRQIAIAHSVSDKTLYAVVKGHRPGKCPRVKRALAAFRAAKRKEARAVLGHD